MHGRNLTIRLVNRICESDIIYFPLNRVCERYFQNETSNEYHEKIGNKKKSHWIHREKRQNIFSRTRTPSTGRKRRLLLASNVPLDNSTRHGVRV